ncbi:hypothetical protein J1N35_013546 [Gossypium stocksii]|uniref:Uncharacterized protein n=1 Tax=Gossypium stocksii TaxID=47602 RepID=A0A9D3VSN7_9ROSI|nr:hypothetical protein J1N35_013546 [Gossypium stocksii]
MDEFYYMWSDDKVNYDDEFYEDRNNNRGTNIDRSYQGFGQIQGKIKDEFLISEKEKPTATTSWEGETLSSWATLILEDKEETVLQKDVKTEIEQIVELTTKCNNGSSTEFAILTTSIPSQLENEQHQDITEGLLKPDDYLHEL